MKEYKPDNLIAGDFPLVTQSITIAAGQTLERGAVLGRISANGQYVLSQVKASDGSESPNVVLAQNIDTTDGESEATCYLSGQFNSAALTFGAGHTTGSAMHTLRQLNIYISESV
jgi:hypothetical protein